MLGLGVSAQELGLGLATQGCGFGLELETKALLRYI